MNNIYKDHVPVSAGVFLKLEDGKEVRVRIVSEPYVFNSVYTDKNTGESSMSTKYAWIVYNQIEKVGQILQLPPTAYKEVAKYGADPDYGDPTKYDLKITRNGTGLQTKYSVVASPNKVELPKEVLESVDVDMEKHIPEAILLSEFTYKKAPLPEPTPDDLPDETSDEPIDLSEIPF